MKKRLFRIILAGILLIGTLFVPGNELVTNAREENANSEIRLLDESIRESVGQMQIMPRGQFLQSGYARISDAGNGKITAGGTTYAQMEVEDICISVEVQKLEGTKWKTYKMWNVEEKNKSVLTSTETFKVEEGYYRVVCLHIANSDISSSSTNGLFME